MNVQLSLALDLYYRAHDIISHSVYADEVEWQRNLCSHNFSETDLIRETAWVILCSGFKESIVRKIFNYISLCFFDWESSEIIVSNADICQNTALASFGNTKKIEAVIETANIVHDIGFKHIKEAILADPINELRRFPYIGPVTSYHLAKNLGFQIAKPDRHLVRYSRAFGFNDATTLCSAISNATNEPINVVDIILWRFAASYDEHQPSI